MLEIVAVPALSDNYIWLAGDPATGTALVVDPGEAAPVLAEAERRGWRVSDVWITHWHPDHIGGLAEVKARTGARATGPGAEAAQIEGLDVQVAGGETATFGAHRAGVIEVPGHTAGHVAFYLEEEGAAFVGDTLFAMGCGRLFEGTPAQMFDSLRRLAALPPATQVYAGHEYTLSNALWATGVEPDNLPLAARVLEVERMREDGRPTLPTTIARELETNPFVRAPTAERFAELRRLKDGAK